MNTIKIGIDAGGTLMKIVYEEKDRFHYKKYAIEQLQDLLKWIRMTAPGAPIALTGGKSASIKENYLHYANVIPEFNASIEGASFLMKKEGIWKENFLLINIGTGTSIYLNQGESFSRILGSGIGGGTFMGLGKLLTGKTDFSELVALAEKGDKERADLLVKDIYFPNEPPIEGSLTASNFGKVNENISDCDKMASIANMIAETMALLGMQAAKQNNTKTIVFIGSTLINNKRLKERLKYYIKMFGLEAIFLENGEYSGAMGAFLSL